MLTNGDPRSFMYYNGDFYINGTEVALKDSYIQNVRFNGRKLWKYARFTRQTIYNGQNAYMFSICRNFLSSKEVNSDNIQEVRECASVFVLTALELYIAIESFVHPIKLDKATSDAIMENITQPKRDWDNSGLMLAWVVYIAAMIGSLIFNYFYVLWVIISLIFFNIRKDMLNS